MSAGAVEELIAQNRVVARAQARLLELVLQVADAAPDPRFAADEIAFALTWTTRTADAQENLARQLIHDLPEVHAALRHGDIDLPKARVFADILQTVNPQIAQHVAAQVLPAAPAKTTAQLRAILHRRALAADPAHTRKRRQQGEQERRVIVEPAADGTARLTALGLPPHRAQAAFERISAIAKARKLSGATATLDQLRTDALLDLLDGTHIDVVPGPRRGVVELLVGLDTVAGLDENPGLLNGFGPVAADIARQCAAANLDAQWRFSVFDPETGQLLLHNLTRARPTPDPSQPPGSPAQPAQQPSRNPEQPAQHQPPRPTQPAQHTPSNHASPAQHPPSNPPQPAQHPPSSSAEPAQRAPSKPPQPAQHADNHTQPRQRPPGSSAQPEQHAPRNPEQLAQRPPGSPAQPAQTRPTPRPPAQDPNARFPNAAMTAWIRARDRTCRAPGCRIPARNCHLDHTIDYARGGRTTHDDLGPACAHHHGMKHEGGWHLHQPRPGHFIWISPSGRIYHVGPEPP